MSSTGQKQQIVGWREVVSLPEWGVDRVIAKIDTGARTSALHVENIEELPDDRVRFDVILSRKNPSRRVTVEAELIRRTRVRPSSGHLHDRHVVLTTMRLGSVEKPVEISLVCRKHMLCRMLVGRTALEEDFLVDAGRKYAWGGPHGHHPRRSRAKTEKGKADTS